MTGGAPAAAQSLRDDVEALREHPLAVQVQ
jgi:hypothetical protein